MFVELFHELRRAGVPVSLKEYLVLMEAMDARIANVSVEDFYHLSRATLVKDERNFDKFDVVFGHLFRGLESLDGDRTEEIPEEWLRKLAELALTEEEMAEVEAMGGFEKLMEELRKRLEEQRKRHQGGDRWIGTAGRSPFGAHGYNPEGVRIGQNGSRHRRAIKVWDRREYRNLDDTVVLGTRDIKVALRRLRRFAREGAALELDLPDTVRSTANNGGYLDLKLVPERRNTVKVLLFLDIGGSMDDHTRTCEELFSAASGEFKHLEYFYFHNFVYEYVWRDNRRRHRERIPTWDVMHTYASDYKLIVVGDATMSPYEIAFPGGSVEHWNEESGQIWLDRLLTAYPSAVWLNPVAERRWSHTQSLQMTRQLMGGRMFPLTVDGLDRGMRELSR